MNRLALAGQIINDVCRQYGVSKKKLMSYRRWPSVVEARHAAMFRVREETGLSFTEMSHLFGRDKSTIRYAVRKEREKNNAIST